jgi:nitrogen fixation protein NifU and related proteins
VTDLDELYQSIILDHNRRPRNFGEPAASSCHASGRNPLCGDEVTVWMTVEGTIIREINFIGQGCAISKASTSLMTEAVRGKSRADALAIFDRVHELLTGTLDVGYNRKALGQIAALGNVSRFPIRVKCASLGWHAFRNALLSSDEAHT